MEGERTNSTPSEGLGDSIQKVRALHGRTSGPTRRSTKGQWTPEEDEILRRAVQRFKGKNWKKIAECFKDRTDVQCLHRWQKVLNPELVKGPWSKEEDEVIIELVKKYGPKKWSTIAQHLPGRIGKQCRERWHNHLNPGINKEAWTQEEELALIRAHQMYGNKWAELTKFLPGRTDNSIKNHWNSSVKKKLDSYLKSGLLTQFQGMPHVGNQNQHMMSSSSRMQSSGDDSGAKGAEVEEISECSQDSTVAGHYLSAPEMANVVPHTREEFGNNDVSRLSNDPSCSPASCSEPYYPSMTIGDANFSVPEIPPELVCSKFLEQNFSHDAGASMGGDFQLNLHELPNISSLECGQESSSMYTHCMRSNESHEGVEAPFQTSTSMGNMAFGSVKSEHMLISDDECCRALFSMNGGCFPSRDFTNCSNIVDLGACTDSVLLQPANLQISETGRPSASQSYQPLNSAVIGTSCSQVVSAHENPLIYAGEPTHLFRVQDQEFVTSLNDGFIYNNESASSPCKSDLVNDSSKLVPVNTFGSGLDAQTCPVDVSSNEQTEQQDDGKEQQDAGALCYEPPRFPSLDIPFFSCDLIQSCNDMQQEYSPLGIRQLMMSSMNCLTPYRLWDSPSREGSPDALLKSAAKTFTGTPSILKKRHRDLLSPLSPLSDRRIDKRLGTDVTSCLARDFSRLDVMFEDTEKKEDSLSPSSDQKRNSDASGENKENKGTCENKVEKGIDSTAMSDDGTAQRDFDDGQSREKGQQFQQTADVDAKSKVDVVPTTQSAQPSGVLVERNTNDLLLNSPDVVGCKAEKPFSSTARTPKEQLRKSFEAPNPGGPSKSFSARQCSSVKTPTICVKKHGILADKCVQSDSTSAPPETDSAGNDVNIESMFGGTPFKRSIESPSAWKSPWFINSFVPGPRVDTEITIEDIGFFMSPGERSYDAIGLMKQISEQTAAAYANAQEVLGNETPESLFRERQKDRDIAGPENKQGSPNQPGSSSLSASNVLVECRTLDFSECGTPGKKGTENVKTSSNAKSFSSPTSYLLKGCR
ncbi:hypothetical protein ACFX2F_017075 [Malus domestica]|uniref:transcription factor MYB3R-1-like isoform X1 n=1 Tax=Malus domestica TaxID=3750 RepID=UPI0039762296